MCGFFIEARLFLSFNAFASIGPSEFVRHDKITLFTLYVHVCKLYRFKKNWTVLIIVEMQFSILPSSREGFFLSVRLLVQSGPGFNGWLLTSSEWMKLHPHCLGVIESIYKWLWFVCTTVNFVCLIVDLSGKSRKDASLTTQTCSRSSPTGQLLSEKDDHKKMNIKKNIKGFTINNGPA